MLNKDKKTCLHAFMLQKISVDNKNFLKLIFLMVIYFFSMQRTHRTLNLLTKKLNH